MHIILTCIERTTVHKIKDTFLDSLEYPLYTGLYKVIIYNYGLHKKLISIIIQLGRSYLIKPDRLRFIMFLKFDNYGYSLQEGHNGIILYCTKPQRSNKLKLIDINVFV